MLVGMIRISAATEACCWLWFTLVYNLVEAVISLWAAKQANSLALLSFGLDSTVESAATLIVLVTLWRNNWHLQHQHADPITQKLLGGTFWLLSGYILIESLQTLSHHQAAEPTVWGLAIGFASAVLMPILARRKMQLGSQLNNPAIMAEATETLACGMLSITMLVGLVLNQWLGWWWADAVAALAMIPWLFREGFHVWKGHICHH
jgi:divalent metal cation (Fe/Co/Zn/Cd) transporter